jgi:serine protease Do
VTKRNRLIVVLIVAVAFVVGLVVATAADLRSTVQPALFAQTDTQPGTSHSSPVSFDARTFREIAKQQMPMVVNIRTESRRQTRDLADFFERNELLERFFGFREPLQPREYVTEGAGSGFIIDAGGLILTNHHVIDGATKITVGLYADEDGTEYEARVVGRDPLTDSALIELTEKPDHPLPTATLGRSRDVQPGDWVMAIGNPFNLAHTVTVGVISAIGRPFPVSERRWQDVLQTDAAINPGNSGGPLLNVRGEVVGVNMAILSNGPSAGNVGVGFAIPIDAVSELLPELRRGSITRGRIGVQISPVTKNLVEPLGLQAAEGALVRVVERGGPAAAAGIQPGDVIVQYNGKAVKKSDDLVEAVTRTKPGTTVPVDVVRNGKPQTLDVTVAKLELEDGDRQTETADETQLGIALRDLSPDIARRLNLPAERKGALVGQVERGSPAARSGIRAGDVILEVNRTSVASAAEAATALRQPEQTTVLVLLWREGQEVFVTMTPRD